MVGANADVSMTKKYKGMTRGPWGAGCDIFDGQEEQNKYMKFINPHVNEEGIVDNISIKFISGVY